MRSFIKLSLWGHLSPGERHIRKRYSHLRVMFPELGVQLTFFANLARELNDKELNLIIPITLNQDSIELIKNYVIVVWSIKNSIITSNTYCKF